MLMAAGIDLPRQVWVHGWLLTGGERMSKSRGNFLDPHDVVRAFGADGARYVTLRDVAFDKDTEVSWDSFVRRYNADLANDFGNLLNRTLSMTARYLDGERPAPTADNALAAAWPEIVRRYGEKLEGCRLHEAAATLWEFVGAANRYVDAEAPWALAKALKNGDAAAGERLRGVLGNLLEACRLITFAAAPYLPSAAPRAAEQQGITWPYAPDGNGGPDLRAVLRWGAGPEGGRIGGAAPLFPRLDSEAVNAAEG
jgi:methionyl-tRNA synthetase